MNKVILGLILAVCVLGMALVMLNERLGRKNDYSVSPTQMSDSGFSQDSNLSREKVDVPTGSSHLGTSPEIADAARIAEKNEARAALAPLTIQPASPSEREIGLEQEREALRLAAEVQLSSEAATPKQSLPEKAVEQPPRLPERPARTPDETKNSVKQPDPKKFEQHQKPRMVTELPGKKVSTSVEAVDKPRPAQAVEKPKPVPAAVDKPKAEKPVAEKPKASQTPEKNRQPATQQDVKRFVVYARENGATVRISGNNSMAWRSMILDNPPRVVVDLDGVWNFPPNPGVPKNELVNNVRVGKTSDNRTRVVIDLKQKPKNARVIGAKDGEGIDVRVDK